MLSVIIPTRNRSPLLRLALESLVTQTFPPDRFEVLVIDNGSSDDTREVVRSFETRIGSLRYFFDSTPGLHVGRHLGMKEANGDLLVYADDDTQALPTWLEAIADCFNDPSVALVGGNNLPGFEGTPPPWLKHLWSRPSRELGGRAITSLSILELPPGRRSVSPLTVWGCNFAIRRPVLIKAGGFHPDGMPEDQIRFRGDGETHVSIQVLKTGLGAVFDSRASVYHAVTRNRMTFEYFRKRAFSQGVSDSYTHLRAVGSEQGAPLSKRGGLAVVRGVARRLRIRAEGIFAGGSQQRHLAREMALGYRDGYEYHQTAYSSDPEVRRWVHRPDYY